MSIVVDWFSLGDPTLTCPSVQPSMLENGNPASRPHQRRVCVYRNLGARKVPLPKVALSDLQNRFSLLLPIIRTYIFDTFRKDGYYLRRPDMHKQRIAVLDSSLGS